MTDNELIEIFAKLAFAQAKTEAQMARTDKKSERIGTRIGNISDNNGSSVEDYFFNSLGKKLN